MSGGRAVFEAINGPAPGKFLQTTHGTTHYVLEGPEDAPMLVVLQHGIGGALSLFDRIAADLVKQGCRVLRYEFYDRGYSESDPEKYPVTAVSHTLRFTLDVYVEQCREVLEGLGLADKDMVHCGHSCGGVTGIGYAARYPEHVKGLCLVDAVCLPALKPLAARIADLPVLGNLVVRALGRRTMVKFTRGACRDPDGDAVRDFLERPAPCRIDQSYDLHAIEQTQDGYGSAQARRETSARIRVFSPPVAPRAATARASWGAPRTSSARSAGSRSRCG